MAAFDAYVPIVHTAADGLAQFLDTLSADEWQRPSACELWTIRDVVAHLIWVADFYTDTVSRGMHGDISLPADRPPGDALDPAAMPAYFDQHAIRVRDRVGAALLPTFRASYGALSNDPHPGRSRQRQSAGLTPLLSTAVPQDLPLRLRFSPACTVPQRSRLLRSRQKTELLPMFPLPPPG
jgi:uncharacterized protein (TIGR03083 family)